MANKAKETEKKELKSNLQPDGSVIVPINTQFVVDKDMIAYVNDISNGFTASETAKRNGTNLNTLQAKLIQIRNYLNCNSLSHLVAYFLRNNIIK